VIDQNKIDDLKEKVGNEELAETIEEIIEQKVEERIQEQKEKQKKESKDEQIDRRSFMKKIGAGAIGLGAASLIPSTSALDVRDSTGLSVYQDSKEYLDVSSSAVNILNTVLKEQGNRVATRNWATNNNINHSDLGTTNSDDHHTKYTDNDAVSALESSQASISTSFPQRSINNPGGNGTKTGLQLVDPTADNYGGNIYFDDGSSEIRMYGLNSGSETGGLEVDRDNGTVSANGNRVLTTADEGSGNGLNADTVDGKEASELDSVSSSGGSETGQLRVKSGVLQYSNNSKNKLKSFTTNQGGSGFYTTTKATNITGTKLKGIGTLHIGNYTGGSTGYSLNVKLSVNSVNKANGYIGGASVVKSDKRILETSNKTNFTSDDVTLVVSGKGGDTSNTIYGSLSAYTGEYYDITLK